MQAPVFFLRGIIHNDVKKLVHFTYTVVKLHKNSIDIIRYGENVQIN